MPLETPASAPRPDFYTFIHKALRRQLFGVVTSAAAADFSNGDALVPLAAEFIRLSGSLRAHGAHENAFLHPVLSRHVPEAAGRLGAAHEKQEAWLDDLERTFEAARQARSVEGGAAFVRELGRFAGYYLVHLAEEEDLNAEISIRVPVEELSVAMAAFQVSRSPDVVASDLELMLPALNRQDRAGILGRLKATAPPAFIFVMEIARRVLDSRAVHDLESDLDVGTTGGD